MLTILISAFALLVDSLWALRLLQRYPVRNVLQKQIYFTGLQSLYPMLLIGGMTGLIVGLMFDRQLGDGAMEALPLLGWILFKELGPILVAFLLVARSAPAMTGEVAIMKLTGEFASLRGMNISVTGYIYLPRILGMAISMVILTYLVSFAAIFMAALAIGGVERLIPVLDAWATVQTLSDVVSAGVKGAIFGVVAAAMAIANGLSVRQSQIEVPTATARSVLYSIVSVLTIDGAWIALDALLFGPTGGLA